MSSVKPFAIVSFSNAPQERQKFADFKKDLERVVGADVERGVTNAKTVDGRVNDPTGEADKAAVPGGRAPVKN